MYWEAMSGARFGVSALRAEGRLPQSERERRRRDVMEPSDESLGTVAGIGGG